MIWIMGWSNHLSVGAFITTAGEQGKVFPICVPRFCSCAAEHLALLSFTTTLSSAAPCTRSGTRCSFTMYLYLTAKCLQGHNLRGVSFPKDKDCMRGFACFTSALLPVQALPFGLHIVREKFWGNAPFTSSILCSGPESSFVFRTCSSKTPWQDPLRLRLCSTSIAGQEEGQSFDQQVRSTTSSWSTTSSYTPG